MWDIHKYSWRSEKLNINILNYFGFFKTACKFHIYPSISCFHVHSKLMIISPYMDNSLIHAMIIVVDVLKKHISLHCTQCLFLPSSAKAKPQLEAELVLILISPAPNHQPARTSSEKVGNQRNLLSNDCSTIPACSKIAKKTMLQSRITSYLAYLTPAWTELGTAQPQLVFYYRPEIIFQEGWLPTMFLVFLIKPINDQSTNERIQMGKF
jgi:hypothetical protein